MTHKQLTVGIAAVLGVSVVLLFFVFGNPFSAVEQRLPSDALSGATGGQLIVQDQVEGTGPAVTVGSVVAVHYTGAFQDGTVFDTSVGGQPFQFVVGGGDVIPGWDQGLQGMKVGGKRILIIPPELAYGSQGFGPIPPNSTLVFEVELVEIVEQ